LGIGQVHGDLVRPAARPPADRTRAGECPDRFVPGGRDGFGDQVRALGQPCFMLGRVVRHTPVRYIASGDQCGRAGRYDLRRPPVAARDVAGQLLERPSRARGYRPFQVTVDDSGELGRAGAKLGEEAVVITNRRPSRGGLPLA